MVDRPEILVVALSGRAIAAAAKRAGYTVVVADLFGDTDLKSVAEKSLTVSGMPAAGLDPQALLTAADVLAPAESPARFGLVYGAGFEARAALLEQLCRGRRLFGNRPDTVARLKDPGEFFGALDRLGVPHPSTSLTPPEDGREWLIKSIGGSGGTHVRRYDGAQADSTAYYQRAAPGRPVGVSFLADGRRAALIGFNEQWHDRSSRAHPFRFGGVLQPTAIGERLARDAQPLLDAVVAEFGLVGLNNLDVMDDGDSYAVLEVNPRPGANLDIFDRGGGVDLFPCHMAACEGQLPDAFRPPSVSAMAVVYADRPLRVVVDLDWPEWVADRPAAGARIEEGAPICTVLANGENAADVRRLVAARASVVRSNFLMANAFSAFDGNSQPTMVEAAHA